MKIKVKAFANVKDIVGFDEKNLTVSEDIKVSDVMQILVKCYPPLNNIKETLLYARNEEYCSSSDILSEEDTLAIFPHVSGG